MNGTASGKRYWRKSWPLLVVAALFILYVSCWYLSGYPTAKRKAEREFLHSRHGHYDSMTFIATDFAEA